MPDVLHLEQVQAFVRAKRFLVSAYSNDLAPRLAAGADAVSNLVGREPRVCDDDRLSSLER